MTETLERIILDPLSENSANAPLELTGRDSGHGVYLVSHAYELGERKRTFAGSIDSEGERPFGPGKRANGRIPVVVWAAEQRGIGAAVNLVTNPSAETGTTGYSAESGAALSATVAESRFGEASLSITTGAFAGSGARVGSVAVPGSQPVYGLAWVKATAGAPIRLRLTERNSADTADVGETDTVAVATGNWQKLTVSRFFGANANARLHVQQTDASVRSIYTDGWTISANAELLESFDGDTPGCEWAGTPHASTSARPATAGKRFTAVLSELEAKVAKITAVGGAYKRVLPSGDAIVFDLLDAEISGRVDRGFNQGGQEVELTFTCRPYGRGPEYQLGTVAESSLPVVVGIAAAGKGTIPGLGRLTATDTENAQRASVIWGIESENFDVSDPANKKLFFEAEDLGQLSGTTAVPGPAGASGTAANKVQRNTDLGKNFQAILSTNLPLGQVPLGHVGTYRVFARIYRPGANLGAVDVALEWSRGLFRHFRRNAVVSFAVDDRENVFTLADLGLVRIPKAVKGLQGWEGRIVARSTVPGDEIEVDWIALVPVSEGYGEARYVNALASPVTRSEYDDFAAHPSGALTGKISPSGEAWTFQTGDADDYQVNAVSDNVTRAAVTDTAPRLVSFGVQNWAQHLIAGEIQLSAIGFEQNHGFFLRYTDANNYIAAVLATPLAPATPAVRLLIRVGGVLSSIGAPVRAQPNAWYTFAAGADGEGRVFAWFGEEGQAINAPALESHHPALASGGALGFGKHGLYDYMPAGTQITRSWRNIRVNPFIVDAALDTAVSMEFRHDAAIREIYPGGNWVAVADYRGDLIRVPPRGREGGKKVRWIVLPSRLPPGSPDVGADNTTTTLHVTPRYDVVPDPA